MNRRSALKYATAMTGIGLSSAFMTGLFSGCQPELKGKAYDPLLLDKDQFAFLRSFANTLIPETDTPGAVELGVPEWIDSIVKKCYTEENQEKFMAQFTQVLTHLNGTAAFATESAASQADKIKALEASLDKEKEVAPAYQSLKGMVASAYLATEYVGKNLLNYLPVPGAYEACIPLSSTNGKAWTI